VATVGVATALPRVERGVSRLGRCFAALLGLAAWLALAPCASAEEVPEYRVKAAFVYNFIAFVDWPADTGTTLTLCIHGADPFGKEIDLLQGKAVAGRSVAVSRRAAGESLKNCQLVFIAASAIDNLPRLLDSLHGQTVLTLADSPGAMQRGVALNLNLSHGKVTFEANLQAARGAGLNISSKLLRLATEVQQ
jgi:YfiR/HmsC-like